MLLFTKRSLGVIVAMLAIGTIGTAHADARFSYGVASGDPGASSVVLWTRAEPVNPNADNPVSLQWQMADGADFDTLVASGTGSANIEDDYTFKVIAEGLAPDKTYYYRFIAGEAVSPVGQTRVLPEGQIDALTLAIFSCVNYPAGLFNAYEAAVREGFDYSVHLGDYIYEYGAGGYATENAAALGRTLSPQTELVTEADYVERYALYTADPDLQALRAAAPMIMMWDDHETANDSWAEGADNHNASDSEAPEFGVPWEERRDNALRVYFRWNPLREPLSGNLLDYDRSFEFGDLADLHMLETRLQGRDVTRADILTALRDRISLYLGGGDAGLLQLIADGSIAGSNKEAMQALLTAGRTAAFTEDESGLAGFQDAATNIALLSLVTEAMDPQRTMLGENQRTDLLGKIKDSEAAWQIIGSQTLMSRMAMPAQVLSGFEELAPLFIKSVLGAATAEEQATLDAFDGQFEVPYNFDAWDGYQVEREMILSALVEAGTANVVISGDTHNAWSSDIRTASGELAAVEFGGPGVTSPGLERLFQAVPHPVTGEPVPYAEEAFLRYVDDLNFANIKDRGYMSLRVSKAEVETEFHFVSTTASKDYTVETVVHTARRSSF